LTIIGYSLNDTIIVFDRIRGDMKLLRGRNVKFADVIDIAINGTLSRTILTSMSTLFVVVVLFIFGGGAIQDFALALLIGIIVGTFSSIYVASPVVLYWQMWRDRRYGHTDGGGGDEPVRRVSKKKRKKKPRPDAETAAT
jgi:preprotein translocase subunit SecF